MKAIKALLYIVLLVISPDIFAGIFDPPPTDKSVSLLGIIFGPNIGNVYLGGTANPTLSSIMEKFNFFIVVAGTIVVSYVGIMSTINTAQEGTAMGKKWSAVWVPMRSIAGMALMIPSPASGYSMIQVTVIWIVVQGIGAADQLWNIALNGLANGVSASAGTVGQFNSTGGAIGSEPVRANGKKLALNVLEAAICMETLYQAAKSIDNQTGNQGGPNWLGKNGTYIKNFTTPPEVHWGYDKGQKTSATLIGKSYFGVENPAEMQHYDVCGKIDVKASVSANEFADPKKVDQNELLKAAQLAYDTKLLAISTMLSILRPLAQGLVIQSAPPHTTYPNEPEFENPVEEQPGYALAAVDAYESLMMSLVIPERGDADVLTKAIIKAGKDNGWIVAGSFYFILNKTLTSQIFRTAAENISQPSQYDMTCMGAPWTTNEYCKFNTTAANGGYTDAYTNLTSAGLVQAAELAEFARYLQRGRNYLANDTADPTSTTSAFGSIPNLPGEIDDIMAPANAAGSQAIKDMMNIMGENSGVGDPLLSHSIAGKKIMLGCEAALVIITVANLLIASAVGALGILSSIETAILALLAVVTTFLGSLWALGASMAIYMPLIPYMIFTMAAIGWMLTVVEAVVAGPIIALGLVTPSGDELGKLEHSLMLLANIFLRPMLMIFGFLLAGRVYKAAINLIGFGMADVFRTIDVFTLFSAVPIMFMYATFVMSITNVCFSLIYAVPDKILTWMGGKGESSSSIVDPALGEVKSSAGGMAKSIGGDMSKGAAHGGNQAVATSNANAERSRNAGGSGAANNPIGKALGGGGSKGGKGGKGGGGGGGGTTT